MTSVMLWPDEVREAALDLYRGGLSTLQVSEQLEVPSGTVSTWVRKAGLVGKHQRGHPRELRERALSLVLDGATPATVAAELGLPGSTVWWWVRKSERAAAAVHGLCKYTPEQKERVMAMLAVERPHREIAEATGVSLSSVQKWSSKAKRDDSRRYEIRYLVRPSGDMRWQEEALCRGMDAKEAERVFFPDESDERTNREAKAICAHCPVREDCLAYAMRAFERYGVWGGTSERERRQMRRASKGDAK